MAMTTKELRLKAAELIDQHGWCQYEMRTDDGRICLLEAVCEAAGRDFMASDSLLQELRDSGMPNGVMLWNDADGRTQSEVLAKLREGLQ